MSEWYKQSVQEVVNSLQSDPNRGLDDSAVSERLQKYGLNELVERGSRSPWAILWDQLTETMVIILFVAAIVSAILGDLKDAIAILAIVVVNSLLGFRQEYQAEQAMAALKKLAVPTVRARRNGHVQEISAKNLVPGDVILLEAGNLVPADCRLIESVNLRAQEAALTGESEPVIKEIEIPVSGDLPLGDRKNMVFMGTVISYGRGQALVTDTGMHTELGAIAELMQTAGQESTPLQKRLDQLGKGLAAVALLLVAIVFLLGVLRGEDFRVLFLTSISIAVAAVPEGLPAVVTIALALGARRMLKRRALIRKLPAVETLGSVTVICSDKTGTLTENRMTVTVLDVAENRIDLTQEMMGMTQGKNPCDEDGATDADLSKKLGSNQPLVLLLAGGALCNDALLECLDEKLGQFSIVGDPTEGALVVAGARAGLSKEMLEKSFPRVAEVPFDSDRKRMTTVHRLPDRTAEVPAAVRPVWDWEGWRNTGNLAFISFTKGAVDSLLQVSDRVWSEGQIEPLDDHWRERIEASNASLAQNGMRVLGVGCRGWDSLPGATEAELEQGLVFVGLFGMIDPARPEVKDAVATCKSAGIRPIMITGDHPLTARYIATELGISNDSRVVTGQDLDRMSVQELEQAVVETSVYARVSPEHKLNIVQALQTRKEIAAMTGDGVNDAPALRKADIGIAMGITGTDVSKEAADMVLLDDNFATIVAAVEEGRVIYDNIRRFVKYLTSCNSGEIVTMLIGPLLGMPLPLLPLQILWMNLVTDGMPALALGVESAERNVMHRKPYPPGENIFARGLGRDIIWMGLLMGLITLGVGYAYWSAGNEKWQTMVFSTLTFSQMFLALGVRSERDSLFRIGLFSNKALVGAVLLTFLLQIGVIYLPFMQVLMETVALSPTELIFSLAISTIVFWTVELQKWVVRRIA